MNHDRVARALKSKGLQAEGVATTLGQRESSYGRNPTWGLKAGPCRGGGSCGPLGDTSHWPQGRSKDSRPLPPACGLSTLRWQG